MSDVVHIEYWPTDDFELYVASVDDNGNPLVITPGSVGTMRLYKGDELKDTITATPMETDYLVEAPASECAVWASEDWTDYTFQITPFGGKAKTVIYGALVEKARWGRG